MRSRAAACACGDLTLAVVGEPEAVVICSCRQCQRRTGSAYSLHAFFPSAAVTVSGEHKSYRRTADSGRAVTFHFCPRCATSLFWEAEARPASVGVAAGGFAEPDFPPPQSAIWAEGKAHWVELPADIPQHPRGTPQPRSLSESLHGESS